MKTFQALAAITVAFVTTAIARAHDGPRVWVTDFNGTIVTETSDNDYDPTTYWPTQVYTGELSPYFGTYTTQFPGYESPRDGSGDVPEGTDFGFKIAGPLLTLNLSSTALVPTSQRFAGQPIPQLAVTFPDVSPDQAASYTRYTSAGVVNGYDFTTSIEEHVHLAYTMLGDGVSASVGGPDGVYVLPMVLTSPTLQMSKWYFLTFKKGGTDEATAQAAGFAQQMAAALPGDTNFDGKVNFNDLVTLAQHYNTPGSQWWATGDFNFDGNVNFADLVDLAQNYGSPAFSNDWALAQSLVPEPTGVAVVIGCSGIMFRRRFLNENRRVKTDADPRS